MSDAQTTDEQTPVRPNGVWVNQRPTRAELYDWFVDAIDPHDGMGWDDWIGGIAVLGDTKREPEVVGFDDRGSPQINYVERVVYSPYVKAETRVAYAHALARVNEWTLHVRPAQDENTMRDGLPAGYFVHTLGSQLHVGYTVEVRFLDRDGKPVLGPVRGSRMVAFNNGDAISQVETQAIARALGFLGILVIPGAGIATAEDIVDHSVTIPPPTPPPARPPADPPHVAKARTDEAPEQADSGAGDRQDTSTPEASSTAGDATSSEDPKAEARALIETLRTSDETAYKAFTGWAKRRGFDPAKAELGTDDWNAIAAYIRRALDRLEQGEDA